MNTNEIVWAESTSYTLGEYKIVVNGTILMRLHLAMERYLASLHEHYADDTIVVKKFVAFVAVELFLPVQVLLV